MAASPPGTPAEILIVRKDVDDLSKKVMHVETRLDGMDGKLDQVLGMMGKVGTTTWPKVLAIVCGAIGAAAAPTAGLYFLTIGPIVRAQQDAVQAITRVDDNSAKRHDDIVAALRAHESQAMHPGTFAEFQKVNQQLQRVETQMHAMSVLNNERAETNRMLLIMGWPADRPKPEPMRNFPVFGTDTGVPHSDIQTTIGR